MSTPQDNLLKELKELLFKYDVSIEFTCSDCSDTHGIYDAHMTISQNKHPWNTIFKTQGWGISSQDL